MHFFDFQINEIFSWENLYFHRRDVWFRQLHAAPVFLPAAHRRRTSIFNQVSLSPSRYIARFNFISCNRVVESMLSLAQWRSSALFNRLIRSNGTFPFFFKVSSSSSVPTFLRSFVIERVSRRRFHACRDRDRARYDNCNRAYRKSAIVRTSLNLASN